MSLALAVVVISGAARVEAQSCPQHIFQGYAIEACPRVLSNPADVESWSDLSGGSMDHPVQPTFVSSPGYEEGQRRARETTLVDIPASIVPSVIPPPAIIVQAALIAANNSRNNAIARAAGSLSDAARQTGVTIAPTLLVPAPAPAFPGLQGGGQREVIQNPRLTDGVRGGSDPVDPSTGEFGHTAVDLELPSAGVSFRQVRTYRSRNGGSGPLGVGWDHGYDRRVTSIFGGAALDTGEASVLAFVHTEVSVLVLPGDRLQIDAKYAAAGGGPVRLASKAIQDASGTFYLEWVLTGDDGTVTRFDGMGQMVSTVDRHGRGLTFVWSGNRLTEVRDSVGRVIDYHYAPSGFLSEVVDRGSGLRAIYEVDGAGDLRSVTSWRGVVERYEYAGMPSDPDVGGVQPTSVAAACAGACRTTTCSPASIAAGCAGQCSTCKATCFAPCVAGCGCEETCRPACQGACQNRGGALCEDQWSEQGGESACSSCDDRCADNCDEECTAAVTCAFDGNSYACQGRDDGNLLQDVGNLAITFFAGIGEVIQCAAQGVCSVIFGIFGKDCDLGCDFETAEEYARRFCQKDCSVCCAYGDECSPDSCNVGETCEDECRRGFLGQPSATTCIASGTLEGYSDYDACPRRMERQCADLCTDVCRPNCILGLNTECAPTCKVECQIGCEVCESQCESAAASSCPAACEETCTATARALGPRYGYRRDLAHNLIRIRNGAGELVLENVYGEDITRPSFDSVIAQHMGEWSVALDYRDLAGEAAGLVPAPTSGLAAQYAVSSNGYQPVTICPYLMEYAGPWIGVGDRPARAAVIRDAYGVPRTFYYDARGRTLRSVNHVTLAADSYEYDAENRVSGSLGPRNARTCRTVVDMPELGRQQTQTRRYPGWDGNAPVVAVYGDESVGASRRLNFTVDESLSRINYTTNPVGDILTATSPAIGPVTTRTYLGGYLDTERDELTGLSRSFTYDLLGLPRTETVGTGAAAQTMTTERDHSGRVLYRQDAMGNLVFYEWNGGMLEGITSQVAGRILHVGLEYDAAQRPWRVTDGQKQTELAYDSLGRPQVITIRALDGTAADQVTCVHRGPDGRVLETVSPEGERTRFTHDGEGRVTRVEAGALTPSEAPWDDACATPNGTESGVVAEAHYDNAGRLDLSWEATTEAWTAYSYDGLDRVVKVRAPGGLERRFGYDARGLVVWEMSHSEGGTPTWPPAENDPRLLAAAEHQYDALGRLIRTDEWHLVRGVRVGDGRETTTWVYEPFIVTVTSDSEGQTAVTRDDAGREVSRRLAGGQVVTTSYGIAHDRVSMSVRAPTPTDTLETTTVLTPFGQPAERWVGGRRVATWMYDDRLRLRREEHDWLGATEYTYDAFDRVTQTIASGDGADNAIETFSWDRTNRLAGHTTPLDATTWVRDGMGRLIEEETLAGGQTFGYLGASTLPRWRMSGSHVSFSYELGHLRREQGTTETRTFEWDALGRMTRASRGPSSSSTLTSDVRFSYDTLGNIVSETGGAASFTHAYDGRRRVETNGVHRTFDFLGRTVKLERGGAVLATWHYSGIGGPTVRVNADGSTTSYRYDEQGRKTHVSRALNGSPNESFQREFNDSTRTIRTFQTNAPDVAGYLDGRGRTIREVELDGAHAERSYAVDGGHNIVHWLAPDRDEWAAPSAGDLYETLEGQPLSYDAAGHVTAHGARSFVWSDFGELVRVEGGEPVQFSYDGLGRVTSRVQGSNREDFQWDGWRRAGRTMAGERSTLIAGDGLDEIAFEEWTIDNVTPPGGAALRGPAPEPATHMLVPVEQDELSTPIFADQGRWVDARRRTAYGEAPPIGGPTTLGYQGQLHEPATDLVQMRARWYNPRWGRFLSPDPVGLAGGSNRFAFASGAHALFSDPFGLSPQAPTGQYDGVDPYETPWHAQTWHMPAGRFDLVSYNTGSDYGHGPWVNVALNGGASIANLIVTPVNVTFNGLGEIEDAVVTRIAGDGDPNDVRRMFIVFGAAYEVAALPELFAAARLAAANRFSTFVLERHVFKAFDDTSLLIAGERGAGAAATPRLGNATSEISAARWTAGGTTGEGFRSFYALKKRLGPAGPGQAWHHIVEQTPGNIARFGAEAVHNTANVVKLQHGAGSIHARVSGLYSSIRPDITGSTSLTVRQWLSSQSFDAQFTFGQRAIEYISTGVWP